MKDYNNPHGQESFLADVLEGKPPVPWSKSTHQLTKHGVRFYDKWEKKFRERKALLKHMKAEHIVITLMPLISVIPVILFDWFWYH